MPSTQRTRLTTINDRLTERVANRIVESRDPEAIYLFGSAARGMPSPKVISTCSL